MNICALGFLTQVFFIQLRNLLFNVQDLIVADDLNSVQNPILDRFGGKCQRKAPALAPFQQSFQQSLVSLIEMWKLLFVFAADICRYLVQKRFASWRRPVLLFLRPLKKLVYFVHKAIIMYPSESAPDADLNSGMPLSTIGPAVNLLEPPSGTTTNTWIWSVEGGDILFLLNSQCCNVLVAFILFFVSVVIFIHSFSIFPSSRSCAS
ncbi:hypothetical protein PsorP6_000779 [Peronosclerospora sorghi]|uniref:Uncharacterized protein n=1 Tax=Peronosclerospora sorghi TaxID=230839 RepID=A0ACC0WUK8_9STRA|nr:hypothetical protein PsorP6_000779 [Peronosclerospora sorghi]